MGELAEAAQHEPQAITDEGKAAVVIAQSEFDRLVGPGEPLAQFFARSGLDGLMIERVEASPRASEVS